MNDYGFVKKQDPEVYAALEGEEKREAEGIELIPSENYVSRAVRETNSSIFTNKYSEGYPGKRYYGGQTYTDIVENLAREANVFAMEAPSYKEIARIITTNDRTRFLHTIEFYPEEGKYHNDGHAACKINLTPEQSAKHRGLCPKCGQKLTIGVLNRVRELADQQPHAQNRVPAKYVVPLQQIIAEVTGTGPKSKTVQQEYERLVKHAPEFTLLLQTPITEIAAVTSYPEIATGIERMRSGQMHIIPGYDGQYGVVKIFEEATKKKEKQGMLF